MPSSGPIGFEIAITKAYNKLWVIVTPQASGSMRALTSCPPRVPGAPGALAPRRGNGDSGVGSIDTLAICLSWNFASFSI